jgi:hypothetical protein
LFGSRLFVVGITKFRGITWLAVFNRQDGVGPDTIENGPKTLKFLSVYVNLRPFLKQKSYRPS